MSRADRQSDFITTAQVLNLADAVDYAFWSNKPLTRFITIHLDQAKVDDAHGFMTKLNALIGDWLRLRGAPLAYVWVLENAPTSGLHVHMLLHVPDDLHHAIAPRMRNWVRLAGGQWRRGVIKTVVVSGIRNHSRGRYSENVTRLVLYMLKGASPTVWFEIEPDPRDGIVASTNHRLKHSYQGVVRGKRVSVSESLSQKRRSSHVWPLRPSRGPLVRWSPRPIVLGHTARAALQEMRGHANAGAPRSGNI